MDLRRITHPWRVNDSHDSPTPPTGQSGCPGSALLTPSGQGPYLIHPCTPTTIWHVVVTQKVFPSQTNYSKMTLFTDTLVLAGVPLLWAVLKWHSWDPFQPCPFSAFLPDPQTFQFSHHCAITFFHLTYPHDMLQFSSLQLIFHRFYFRLLPGDMQEDTGIS